MPEQHSLPFADDTLANQCHQRTERAAGVDRIEQQALCPGDSAYGIALEVTHH